ncbi:MAG: tRNA lysidine(34) synthetase TilS, partial [Acidobacteriota bacterium]|nr:tRNA lysidine(34) synthetase TilS [Acidobacteriota bacterium]
MNRFEADVLAQIRRRGDGIEGCRVLVAVSGGGDSTALLAVLWALRKNLGLDLSLAHADHGLRAEAGEDAYFVRDLARSLDLDLAEACLDVKAHAEQAGLGLETAARELRWAWLRAEAAACGAKAIVTGHTQDDHTETVFLRLQRGGGAGALTPLPARQDPRWSPLIECRRDSLRRYLTGKGLPWREDASNEVPFTARNRWRKLLQTLRDEAPLLDRHLWETHLQVRELRELAEAGLRADQGVRWRVEQDRLWLAGGPWSESRLRGVLELASRQLAWPREAAGLRALAPWLLARLTGHHPVTARAVWGNFTLNLEPNGAYLHR